jgi:hypothetical protein
LEVVVANTVVGLVEGHAMMGYMAHSWILSSI